MPSDLSPLIGITAFLEGKIDVDQLRQAVNSWADQGDRSMADILEESGWISGSEVSGLEERAKSSIARRSIEDGGVALARPSLINFQSPEGEIPEFSSRYEKASFYAKGGMGDVYQAYDSKLGRVVALKVLKQRFANDPPFSRRFLSEARITSRLHHPNIVPIHDLYEISARPYYAMPLLDGATLAESIRRHHAGETESLTLRQLVLAFINVCNAIEHAHSQGLIHRDIKSSNVQVDRFGQAIVLDWGLAKEIESDDDPLAFGIGSPVADAEEAGFESLAATRSFRPLRVGAVIGTLRCIPPEQVRGEHEGIGPSADVFGLGALLYSILTDTLPYQGSSRAEVLANAMKIEFSTPSQLKPNTPKALEAIVLKAMQAKPEERYASAKALADDARRWLDDEPVSAHLENRLARFARWSRKHQPVVAAGAVLLISMIVGLAGWVVIEQINNWKLKLESTKADLSKGQASRDSGNALNLSRSLRELISRKLAVLPGSEDLRGDYSRSLVLYANSHLEIHPNDADAQYQGVSTLLEAADSMISIGDDKTAREYLNQAEGFARRMVGIDPIQPRLKILLAGILEGQARIDLALGQPAKALGFLNEAEQTIDGLVRSSPGFPDFLYLRAVRRLQLSETFRELEQIEPSITSGRNALADIDESIRGIGDRPSLTLGQSTWVVQVMRASILRELAAALLDGGHPEEALKLVGESTSEFDRLGKGLKNTQVDAERLLSHQTRGCILAQSPGGRREALTDLGVAIRGFMTLHRESPRIQSHQLKLALASLDRSSVIAEILTGEFVADTSELRSQAIEDAISAVQLLSPLVRNGSPQDVAIARALNVLDVLEREGW